MLNDRQFWFHGSKADLQPGDSILPANQIGGSNYGYSHHDELPGAWGKESDGSSRGDWTFAADTELEAEHWVPSGPGRPTTYKVAAPGDDVPQAVETRHYRTNFDEGGEHLKAKGPLEVVDRIDIPLPDPDADYVSVQGTLPPVDWNAYKTLPEDSYSRGRALERAREESGLGIFDQGNAVTTYHHRYRHGSQIRAARERMENDGFSYEADWRKAGQQELDL